MGAGPLALVSARRWAHLVVLGTVGDEMMCPVLAKEVRLKHHKASQCPEAQRRKGVA